METTEMGDIMDKLSIAENVQFNLKNLARLKNDPSFITIYDIVCSQVDTLVAMLEEDDED